MPLPCTFAATVIALGLSMGTSLAIAADEKPEDADPGEASYNTEACVDADEDAGEKVEADDLDEECEQVVK